MHTIGDLAKRFAISRSTILYYDSIGLLHPSGRSASGYRLYSEEDIARMEKIMLYRQSGLPLKSITDILDRQENQTQSILENQLAVINGKISELRSQQRTIISILGLDRLASKSRVMTKRRWVSLLKATGLNEEGMKKWHIEFERQSPEAHQDFLEALEIGEEEINEIRRLSAEGTKDEV